MSGSRTVRVVLPEPADGVEVAELYGRGVRPSRGPDGRPWVMVSMVASADGAVVIDGSSAELSSPADQQVLAALRRAADVVLVGAGTVRADRYGAPAHPDLRIAVVTRSGQLDFRGPLFRSGSAVVVTTEDGPDIPDGIAVVSAGRDRVELGQALVELDAGVILSEGGPQLNAQLVADDLVDELCLTMSPVVVGGDSPRLSFGPFPARVHRMRLAHLALDGDFVFLRYLRA